MNGNIRPFIPQTNGNNVPVQRPLIPTPFVPYKCKNCRHVNIFAKADPEIIKKYLEPTPFEYVDNTILLYISDFKNTVSYRISKAKSLFSVTFDDVEEMCRLMYSYKLRQVAAECSEKNENRKNYYPYNFSC